MQPPEHSYVDGETEPYELSPNQAARFLYHRVPVTPRTIRRWAEQGLLPSYNGPGNRRRFRRSDLDKFIDARIEAGQS